MTSQFQKRNYHVTVLSPLPRVRCNLHSESLNGFSSPEDKESVGTPTPRNRHHPRRCNGSPGRAKIPRNAGNNGGIAGTDVCAVNSRTVKEIRFICN